MAVKPLVVLVPEDLAARIQELAGQAGLPVSQWMAAAAQQMTGPADQEARAAAARELLALLEAEDGPITDTELAEFKSRWQDRRLTLAR